MIKCSDLEILLAVGAIMFSLVNSSVAMVFAWILFLLVPIHIVFSKETWNKIFSWLFN